eukprot:TRINITY_DN1172_c0_g1_i1.p1 TRINITY_DN1172_c0_g1~~TRINITY_DN1172_c0_g1_i1.p1  ORF type:complete len:297 (+),score=16.73 TRINITY_DN1172_c0_g1_i1:62-892(+)
MAYLHVRNRAALQAMWPTLSSKPPLLLFYGHKPKGTDVDASCLSQFFPAPFIIDGVQYFTAEHYMHAEKARLFGDAKQLRAILRSKDPLDAKRCGRKVAGFDGPRWAAEREAVVLRGSLAKFAATHNPLLHAFLLSTHPAVLVEAAGRDCIWGIGLGPSNPRAQDPATWRGQNLLGFALMAAREHLRAERSASRAALCTTTGGAAAPSAPEATSTGVPPSAETRGVKRALTPGECPGDDKPAGSTGSDASPPRKRVRSDAPLLPQPSVETPQSERQ